MAKLRGKEKKAHRAAKKGRSDAEKSRSSLKDQRKDARKEGKKGKVKSLTRKIMLQSKEMRKQGNIMRGLTKREKGQRTTYTGPTPKTIRQIKKTTGDVLPGPTDWQNVNTKWLDDIMKANPKYSLSDARLHLKDMFAKDRAAYLKEQQSRYDTKKFATFTNTGKIKDVSLSSARDRDLSGKSSAAGLGDVMLQTPYTRPAPKDWSNLRYTYAGSPESELGQVTQTPASRAMFGNQGRALQPWTGGQGVPASLLNYQVPGGAGFDVTYSGANPSLFDFNQQQNNQQLNNQTKQQVDWAGVPVRTMGVDGVMGYDPEGVPYKDFMDFTTRTQQQYYPGRQAAAQAAGFGGLNYWAPGAEDWRASLPGGAKSADWIDQYGSAAEQADGTFRTATQQLIDQGLITVAKGK